MLKGADQHSLLGPCLPCKRPQTLRGTIHFMKSYVWYKYLPLSIRSSHLMCCTMMKSGPQELSRINLSWGSYRNDLHEIRIKCVLFNSLLLLRRCAQRAAESTVPRQGRGTVDSTVPCQITVAGNCWFNSSLDDLQWKGPKVLRNDNNELKSIGKKNESLISILPLTLTLIPITPPNLILVLFLILVWLRRRIRKALWKHRASMGQIDGKHRGSIRQA